MKRYLILVGILAALIVGSWFLYRDYKFGLAEQAMMDKNYVAAHKLLTPLAESDHVGAQVLLASLYELGDGVQENDETGFYWIKRAADNGDAGSQLLVGSQYLDGYKVEKDPEKGAKYISLSAEQGETYAEMTLGTLYHLGEGVPQDDLQAVQWMTKAVEDGISPPDWYTELTTE